MSWLLDALRDTCPWVVMTRKRQARLLRNAFELGRDSTLSGRSWSGIPTHEYGGPSKPKSRVLHLVSEQRS